MFKIDTVFLRLDGNYLNLVETKYLQRVYKTKTVIRAKKNNLQIVINNRWISVRGSASKFMGVAVNHSNFHVFVEALNDVFCVDDFQHSKITRFDVCYDMETQKNIHSIADGLGGLARFKREKYRNTIYYQTSLKKHKGTKLVIYQKNNTTIRFELRAFKGSKYCLKRVFEVKNLFVRNCEAVFVYYSKIKKLDTFQIENIMNDKQLQIAAYRTIYNALGVSGIENLLNKISNKKHGYRLKNKVLGALDCEKNTVEIDTKLKKALNETICIKI